MKLFSCPATQRAAPGAIAKVITPLGTILLDAKIGDFSPVDDPAEQIDKVGDLGHIFSWHKSRFDVELLLCEPTYRRHSGTTNMGVRAGIWRWAATGYTPPGLFVCRWDGDYQWEEGGPDSAEGLDAKTWYMGSTFVSIGTDDESRLSSSATANLCLPRRLAPYFADSYSGEQAHYAYMKMGIPVPIPELEPGETCQIKFVVAWSSDEADEADIWVALEQDAQTILTDCGCA
ncbi:MAG TPA: hypothetical protein VGK19_11610 [Capsulimonadaceae bacterium]